MMNEALTEVRLDKWLWAARFFKTRTQASKAVKSNQVQVNQQRTRSASRQVRIGDMLTIHKNDEQMEVKVIGLADKRGSAAIAQTLYQETDSSVNAREQAKAQRVTDRLATPKAPEKRPEGKSRAALRQLKRHSH